MIEHPNFYIIHMPRCGGSFIRGSLRGVKFHNPGHEGLAHFNPRGKPVYGLIRAPEPWYRSFFFYARANNLIWNEYFGIKSIDTPEEGIRKLISGEFSKTETIKTPETIDINPGAEMSILGIGFWSWWVLHMYSRNKEKSFKIGDLSRFFWVRNRGRDLGHLRDVHHATLVPNIGSVNASNRPNVRLSPSINNLIRERDGRTLQVIAKLPKQVVNR